MATLLIIGGSGFFGKSILSVYHRGLLAPWGIKTITILSRSATKLKENNKELIDDSIILINQDITSCRNLPLADYVIHAASSSSADKYLEKPLEEKLNISAGAYNYCKLAKKYHNKSKILYISTGAVYGRQPESLESINEMYDITGSVLELSKNKRGYALAKRESEKAFIELGKQGGNVSIARCFTFVGPYLPIDQHFAVGNFIADGLENREITVNTNSQVYRSYMYSDDLVFWLMKILSNAGPNCPIYNVGSDELITITALAEKIAKISNVRARYTIENSNNNVDKYIPNISKAKTELNINITISIDEALVRTINFHKAHAV